MSVPTEHLPGLEATIPVSGIVGTKTPAFTLDRQGGRLDHFEIEKPLGAGGMGAVYLARDASLDRLVAIKVLPDEFALHPEAQERFVREAQAQARVHSPNVVQIFFIGRIPAQVEPPLGAGAAALSTSHPPSVGSLYFAMERVDGESLEARIDRREKLDPEEARRLMIQVARGLRDAQRAGIIHRDIKPGNLLVDRDGNLKVADFGLAKPSDPGLSLTRGGAVMGTPYYMAPEQALGEVVDQRTDMYSIGCTFYHLISGEPPFDGPSQVAVLSKHLKVKPTPLRDREAGVPRRVAAIVDRLLEKERELRYESYDALLDALADAAPEQVEYAGFWARGAALSIDGILACGLIAALGPAGLLLHMAVITGGLAYFGQTAGKYVLRMQVQRLDGGRLGLVRAFVRSVASMWLPFLIGFLILLASGISGLRESIAVLARPEGVHAQVMLAVSHGLLAIVYGAGLVLAAVHRQKRAVHDFLAGSRVVYRMGSRAKVAPHP